MKKKKKAPILHPWWRSLCLSCLGDGVCGPDDIAREICRHCATPELREGNAAVPLTSPCYNAVRSLFVVVRRSPSHRRLLLLLHVLPSPPSPQHLPRRSGGGAVFHFDGPAASGAGRLCRVVETITAVNALRSMDFVEIR